MRVTVHELVVDAARHVGEGELAGLLRDRRVQHHLVEHVAELVLERCDTVGIEVLDRLDRLVGLFEQVPGERRVRLLGVPRTSARVAQALGELDEAHQLARRAHRAGVDEHRREVVGHDRTAVELLERHHRDLLVGEAEALQHRDRRVGPEVLEQRELHVGEHELVVALRDQESAAQLRVFEGAPVDDTRVAVHRIDAEPHPREVRERHARDQFHLDGGIGAQQRDRALGDRGTARHRVDDLTVLVRGRDQPGRDLRVRRLEVGGGVVDVVERRERDAVGQEVVDRGMAQRAGESMRRRRQRRARDRQEVVSTRRSEAQRDDPVRHRGSPSPSPSSRWAGRRRTSGSRTRSAG